VAERGGINATLRSMGEESGVEKRYKRQFGKHGRRKWQREEV